MDNVEDLDFLMDNFDVKTFWQKKKIHMLFALFVTQSAVVGALLIKAVMENAVAGAVPKGMELNSDQTNYVR